jgi:hypothetical protein
VNSLATEWNREEIEDLYPVAEIGRILRGLSPRPYEIRDHVLEDETCGYRTLEIRFGCGMSSEDVRWLLSRLPIFYISPDEDGYGLVFSVDGSQLASIKEEDED